MDYTTLIEPGILFGMMQNQNIVLLDCRYALADLHIGRRQFLNAHIPGAVFMDIGHDLSSPVIPGITGRHPLPHAEILTATLMAAGVEKESQVVVYDQNNGMYASRAWWLLRWLGHDRVAVLNGGMDAWQALGLPMENQWPAPRTGNFIPSVRTHFIVTREQVAREKGKVIDSREFKRYTGEFEPIDSVAGHIAGALCMPYTNNVTSDGRWKSAADLISNFALLRPVDSAEMEPPVFYCGSGVTACHNILAYKIATGLDARLYPGSWSEWIHYYPPETGPVTL